MIEIKINLFEINDVIHMNISMTKVGKLHTHMTSSEKICIILQIYHYSIIVSRHISSTSR